MAESNEYSSDTKEQKDSYKEFSAEKDLSVEEQSKLVTKLDNMFTYAADHPNWIRGRNNMIKCFQYREGEQWTAEELKELEDRHQPDTVNNQIAVVVNKLVGDLVSQRFRVGYVGRNAPVDEEVAKLLSDIFLYVRQSNDLEFEERDMAEDGFTCGFGVLDVYVTFDDLMQPEIKVRHEDPLIVFPDPDSRRYDWNEDARFVARARWWDIDEAVEVYPQQKAALKGLMHDGAGLTGDMGTQLSSVDKFKGEHYVDEKKKRVRIIEVQYKKTKRENLLLIAGQGSRPYENVEEVAPLIKQAKEQGREYRIIDRLNHDICVGVYAAGILLEHKVTAHKFFSLVPYYAYRRKTGEPYSLVTLALPMQDAVNKRESKALHLINTNQIIAEKSAVEDPAKVQQEAAKPDGYIEVKDGALRDQKFQINRNIELAQAQFSMHSRAIEDLYRILGMDPRMGQSTGEIRSGSGLQKKYAEGAKPILTLFDNVRRTRKVFARVVLDRVQKYFTDEKIFLITDDQNKSRTVGLTAPLLEKIKTGQYDAIAQDLDDNETVQQEQFAILTQTLPQILQFGPYWTKKLIQLSSIRDKEAIMKEMDELSGPPPIEPRMSVQVNLDALTPIERAAVWERAGAPDVAQAVRAMQPMTTQEAKGSVELAKETIKKGKADDKKSA